MHQLADRRHPAHAPGLVDGPGAGDVQEVPPHVLPAEGQKKLPRLHPRECLVGRKAVHDEEATFDPRKERFRDPGTPRGVQHVDRRRSGQEYPEPPPGPLLPIERLEDPPTRLVRVPLRLAEMAGHDPVHHRLEDRGDPPQPVRHRARREAQPGRRQVRQQTARGAREEVLVEQHLHPDGDVATPFGNQLRRRRGHHDRREARTLARPPIAPAPEPPPIGTDLDRHLFGIRAVPVRHERQPTALTDAFLLGKVDPFLLDR